MVCASVDIANQDNTKDTYSITLNDIMNWKNKEDESFNEIFRVIQRLFDPPLAKQKFIELSKNYFWVNQALEACETCYLKYAKSKLEELAIAPPNLEVKRYRSKIKPRANRLGHFYKDITVSHKTGAPRSPDLKKGYKLKTELIESSRPRLPTARSMMTGIRYPLSGGIQTERPFSKMSHMTWLQPTEASMNYKIHNQLPSAKRNCL